LRQILDAKLLDVDGTKERQHTPPGSGAPDCPTGDWSIDELSDRKRTDDR
jgi:hypothetical protein